MSACEATYYVHPGAHVVSETWGWLHQRERQQPFVMVFPKQRYALVIVDMGWSGRILTHHGHLQVVDCLQRYSAGVRKWSTSGGRTQLRCERVPLGNAEHCAAAIARGLKNWTIEVDNLDIA
jgi:hypothetical protein